MKTISLKNAKLLHDTAVKYGVSLPESKYWYTKYNHDKFALITLTEADKMFREDHTVDTLFTVPATTDELLEWLPTKLKTPDKHNLFLEKEERYYAGYRAEVPYEGTSIMHECEHENPADAICLLAIELIKKGIIK